LSTPNAGREFGKRENHEGVIDMSEIAQGLLAQAMTLPEEDRRWLGKRLLDAEDADEFPDAPHHDPEFMAELIRRSDEVHAHPERLISNEVVFEKARLLLEQMRAQ
jgi:hypothetical protein